MSDRERHQSRAAVAKLCQIVGHPLLDLSLAISLHRMFGNSQSSQSLKQMVCNNEKFYVVYICTYRSSVNYT